MPGRIASSGDYRYGFNGMEKDDEVHGQTGSSYTANYWQYDSRLGKRWNPDPVVKPWRSPYDAFSNNPIIFVDPNGDDDYFTKSGVYIGSDSKETSYIKVVFDNELIGKAAIYALESSDLPKIKNQKLEATFANKSHYLTDLSIAFKGRKGQLQKKALLSIMNHYSDKYKVGVANHDDKAARAQPEAKRISLGLELNYSKDKNGESNSDPDKRIWQVHSIMGQGNDVTNILKHEDFHIIDHGKYDNNYENEITAVIQQMKDPSWKNTSEEFKNWTYGEFGGFLFTKKGAKYKSEFEKVSGVNFYKTGDRKFEFKKAEK